MKKVLIISYFYAHPANVGGAVRVQKFVKYLAEFGWQPIVLTIPTQLPDGREGKGDVAVADSSLPRSGATEATSNSVMASPRFFAATPGLEVRGHPVVSSYLWLPAAIRAATDIVERERIDIVLANCDPFVSSLVAVQVAKQCKVPAVADFRDAWSFHPYWHEPRFVSKVLESYVLKRISFLVTTSPGTTEEYVTRYRFLASKIETVYNGFDEADFPLSTPAPFDQFTIASVGTLYVSRPLEVLFEAVRQLPSRQIRLVLIGNARGDVLNLAAKHGISRRVEIRGRMGQRDAIQEMCRAQMLFLMRRRTSMRCTPIASKGFEYIRSGLPVLAIAQEGDSVTLLREYAAQAHIVTSYSVAETAEAIEACYQDWEAGSLTMQRNAAFEAAFNRRELTRQLGLLLERVLAGQQGS